MGAFLRLLTGLSLLPACWGGVRAFIDALLAAGGDGMTVEAVSFLGGVAVFALGWAFAPHPVRTYVLGHELTHALWGLLFGAVPSRLKVGAKGGSVRLTKTNVLIVLAPYFFPFYAFVVLVAAMVARLCLGRLPWLQVWLFALGFTWAFHFLFTLQTLTEHQSDVALYGRVFSWVFIFLANLALVLVALAAATDLAFATLGEIARARLGEAYRLVGAGAGWVLRMAKEAYGR